MSRRYSGKKGKAGSKKPIRKGAPSWIRYKSAEIELLVTKLAKEGKTPSQIGLILRDVYGVPDIKNSSGKKLGAILKNKKLSHAIPEDLMALIKRSIAIKKHLEKNKKDQTAKRGLTLTESKIRALVKYYKKKKKLPADWKFEPEKIRLYI
jgi:ribosomal protein S15P/S13E